MIQPKNKNKTKISLTTNTNAGKKTIGKQKVATYYGAMKCTRGQVRPKPWTFFRILSSIQFDCTPVLGTPLVAPRDRKHCPSGWYAYCRQSSCESHRWAHSSYESVRSASLPGSFALTRTGSSDRLSQSSRSIRISGSTKLRKTSLWRMIRELGLS